MEKETPKLKLATSAAALSRNHSLEKLKVLEVELGKVSGYKTSTGLLAKMLMFLERIKQLSDNDPAVVAKVAQLSDLARVEITRIRNDCDALDKQLDEINNVPRRSLLDLNSQE